MTPKGMFPRVSQRREGVKEMEVGGVEGKDIRNTSYLTGASDASCTAHATAVNDDLLQHIFETE